MPARSAANSLGSTAICGLTDGRSTDWDHSLYVPHVAKRLAASAVPLTTGLFTPKSGPTSVVIPIVVWLSGSGNPWQFTLGEDYQNESIKFII